ncbi:hypothetical protein CDAR_397131 [Caerostris darwini]|uniref:Ribosomal protein S11 n=1 Tax=Caerostris darwini TaxID=1538125 RepID=A0AAV4Q4C7_9ARAC|nr:hypothetical protein CDAR_397131 [Caerostris darwini]
MYNRSKCIRRDVLNVLLNAFFLTQLSWQSDHCKKHFLNKPTTKSHKAAKMLKRAIDNFVVAEMETQLCFTAVAICRGAPFGMKIVLNYVSYTFALLQCWNELVEQKTVQFAGHKCPRTRKGQR